MQGKWLWVLHSTHRSDPWNCYKVLEGSLQKLHHILLVKEVKAAMK